MKKLKKKKNAFKKFLTSIFFLFIICLFLYFVNQNIIFKPFILYQGDNNLKVISKNWINNNFAIPFLSKKSLTMMQPDKINKTISSIKIQRKFFLVWSLTINQKISSRYLLLNNQIRAVDEDSNLIDISINQEEIKKQIPFLLKIEILENVPIKKKISDDEKKEQIVPLQKEKVLSTEIDIFNTYENDIKPFVEYLYKTESSLGPKVSLIQFFPKEGLRFFLYDKIYWIGKLKNFALLERNIDKCETYLKKENKIQSYNEFDLRYEYRIICRNNQ
jgi:hypothetical protein